MSRLRGAGSTNVALTLVLRTHQHSSRSSSAAERARFRVEMAWFSYRAG
jgi:hypothetical protein